MEEEAAVDWSHGDGPPCIVETRLPDLHTDKKDRKRLGEDNKGALVSRAKVRPHCHRMILLLIATTFYISFFPVCTTATTVSL